MNTKIQTLCVLATLCAALLVGDTAQAALPPPCTLPITNEVHLLRELHAGTYVEADGSWQGWCGAGDCIEIVPGLSNPSDPTLVSLRSTNDPTRYYSAVSTPGQGISFDVLPDDGTAVFADTATFRMVSGLSTGTCEYSGISFHLVVSGTTNPMYLSRVLMTDRLHLQFEGPNQTTNPAAQTFAIERGDCEE